MGLLGWFRRGDAALFPSFEKALQELELRIERNQEHLADIKRRERWAVVTVTTYALLVWLVYSAVWYMGWIHGRLAHLLGLSGSTATVARLIEAAPVWTVPIGIVFTRRLFHWWYRRKQASEQKQLRSLEKQLRDKVEELKKQTQYYSTRDLLERYDEKLRKNSEIGRQPGVAAPGSSGARKRGPGSLPPASGGRSLQSTPGKTPGTGPLGPVGVGTPGGRGWADRVADVLLGGDEARPENKYALICGKCFSHNGLVMQEELYVVQYTCPRCGHFNPAKPRPAGQPPSTLLASPPPLIRRSSSPVQSRRDPDKSPNSTDNFRDDRSAQTVQFPLNAEKAPSPSDLVEGNTSLGRVSPTETAVAAQRRRAGSSSGLRRRNEGAVPMDED